MKKILFSLFIGLIGIISFCSASNFSDFIIPIKSETVTVNKDQWYEIYYAYGSPGTYCLKVSSITDNLFYGTDGSYGGFNLSWSTNMYPAWGSNFYTCLFTDMSYLYFYGAESTSTISYELFKLNVLLNTEVPKMTSSECEETYNLIPISSVDTNYCVNNNLCPETGPETELSYSKFYVNHGESTWSELSGMENYYVYLPEYLGYNFDYSNGTDLNFTVGVATDTGYINNISAIQNSKPSQEDLNKLVSEVLPLFIPGLAVILFLYFIFRFIKKIF